MRVVAFVKEAVMPFAYSPEYREMVLAQVRAGRRVAELADELEVSESTIHRWKTQDEIDRGERVGVSTRRAPSCRQRGNGLRSLKPSWPPPNGHRSCLMRGGWCAQKSCIRSWRPWALRVTV